MLLNLMYLLQAKRSLQHNFDAPLRLFASLCVYMLECTRYFLPRLAGRHLNLIDLRHTFHDCDTCACWVDAPQLRHVRTILGILMVQDTELMMTNHIDR